MIITADIMWQENGSGQFLILVWQFQMPPLTTVVLIIVSGSTGSDNYY